MRTWVLALFLLASTTMPAAAQGLSIGWDDAPSRGGADNRLFDCDTNTGSNTFVVTLSPAMDLLGVTELGLTVFVEQGEPAICDAFGGLACVPPPLLPWWDFSAGGCRAGALSTSADFQAEPWAGPNTVEDPWGGSATQVARPYQVESITNGVDTSTRGRLTVAIAPVFGTTVDLLAGHEYYLVRGTLTNAHAAGAVTCEGCCQAASIEPDALLVWFAGSTPPVQFGGTGLPLGWQAFRTDGACAATPARTGTWGALKSRYR